MLQRTLWILWFFSSLTHAIAFHVVHEGLKLTYDYSDKMIMVIDNTRQRQELAYYFAQGKFQYRISKMDVDSLYHHSADLIWQPPGNVIHNDTSDSKLHRTIHPQDQSLIIKTVANLITPLVNQIKSDKAELAYARKTFNQYKTAFQQQMKTSWLQSSGEYYITNETFDDLRFALGQLKVDDMTLNNHLMKKLLHLPAEFYQQHANTWDSHIINVYTAQSNWQYIFEKAFRQNMPSRKTWEAALSQFDVFELYRHSQE